MPTEDEVKNFQAIYKAYFGKEIRSEEAFVQAQKLFSFVEVIYVQMRKPDAQAILRCVLEEERIRIEQAGRQDDGADLTSAWGALI